MPAKPNEFKPVLPRKTIRTKYDHPRETKVMIEADGFGLESQRCTFAALVAQGKTGIEAFRIAFPERKENKKKVAAMMKKTEAMVTVLRQQVSQGRAELHGISTRWIMGELKEMYETPLSDIGPESRFCKKYEVRETMTDNGPITTTKIEKDAPLAILKEMAVIGGLTIPSQGSQAALALEERRTTAEEQKADSITEFLASLVQNGAPYARQNPIIDVDVEENKAGDKK